MASSTPELIGRALDALVRVGHVEDEQVEPQAPGHHIKVVRLRVDPETALVTLGSRMRSIVAALQDAGGELPLRALLELEGQSAAASVDRLVEKGLVEKIEREDRAASALTEELGGQGGAAPPPNAAQQTALDAIAAAGSRPLLLHGVTGSGKTEVYLQVIEGVLARGQAALVLVPEIALTPQLVARFRARFGDRIAALHSGLDPDSRSRAVAAHRGGRAARRHRGPLGAVRADPGARPARRRRGARPELQAGHRAALPRPRPRAGARPPRALSGRAGLRDAEPRELAQLPARASSSWSS
jgi:primosomal protein N'